VAASTVSTHVSREAFWVGAIGPLAAAIIAVLMVPAVRRPAAGPAPAH
jgi:hypothetical protein